MRYNTSFYVDEMNSNEKNEKLTKEGVFVLKQRHFELTLRNVKRFQIRYVS